MTTRPGPEPRARRSQAPTSNSEGAPGVARTPCTLWYPRGASVRVGSRCRRSLQRPRATSHTSSRREPSVALGCEYFGLVLQQQSPHQLSGSADATFPPCPLTKPHR